MPPKRRDPNSTTDSSIDAPAPTTHRLTRRATRAAGQTLTWGHALRGPLLVTIPAATPSVPTLHAQRREAEHALMATRLAAWKAARPDMAAILAAEGVLEGSCVEGSAPRAQESGAGSEVLVEGGRQAVEYEKHDEEGAAKPVRPWFPEGGCSWTLDEELPDPVWEMESLERARKGPLPAPGAYEVPEMIQKFFDAEKENNDAKKRFWAYWIDVACKRRWVVMQGDGKLWREEEEGVKAWFTAEADGDEPEVETLDEEEDLVPGYIGNGHNIAADDSEGQVEATDDMDIDNDDTAGDAVGQVVDLDGNHLRQRSAKLEGTEQTNDATIDGVAEDGSLAQMGTLVYESDSEYPDSPYDYDSDLANGIGTRYSATELHSDHDTVVDQNETAAGGRNILGVLHEGTSNLESELTVTQNPETERSHRSMPNPARRSGTPEQDADQAVEPIEDDAVSGEPQAAPEPVSQGQGAATATRPKRTKKGSRNSRRRKQQKPRQKPLHPRHLPGAQRAIWGMEKGIAPDGTRRTWAAKAPKVFWSGHEYPNDIDLANEPAPEIEAEVEEEMRVENWFASVGARSFEEWRAARVNGVKRKAGEMDE